MREWRNWQTQQVESLSNLRVRLPPRAPTRRSTVAKRTQGSSLQPSRSSVRIRPVLPRDERGRQNLRKLRRAVDQYLPRAEKPDYTELALNATVALPALLLWGAVELITQ